MTTPTPGQPLSEADTKSGCVYVEVSGLTGTGKSAVMGEIEIALKALGLAVEYDADFQAEKNGTHADWQEALDLYRPTIVLRERNIPRPHAPVSRPGDGVDGRTPGQVAYEGWAQGLPGCEWSNQTATQKRAWEKAAQAVAALTPPEEPVSRPAGEGEREAVARIIDPLRWRRFDRHPPYADHVPRETRIEWSAALQDSLAKADAILSLLRPAAPDAGKTKVAVEALKLIRSETGVLREDCGLVEVRGQRLTKWHFLADEALSALQPGGER